MQVACFCILVITGLQSLRDGKNVDCSMVFDVLHVVAELAVIFDALTVWSVNNQEIVPRTLNLYFHFFFFILMVTGVYLVCLYFLEITFGITSKKRKRFLLSVPYVVVIFLVAVNMKDLEFIQGKVTSYSMGMAPVISFAFVAVLWFAAYVLFFTGYRKVERHIRTSMVISLTAGTVCTMLQLIFPEILSTSLALTIMVMGIYLNLENPAYKKYLQNTKNMVENFSTLIENRDDSTGGHVKRTTLYVNLIMNEMVKNGKYKKKLTRDYMNYVLQAAPMHDIGKVAIPDSILQKKGPLSPEEFAIMKTHTIRGGDIIQETFGCNSDDPDFVEIAFKVCQFHHEKWNGKGYPEGISGTYIPLCARIMAVADVFDAVSAKRCYRDAMPLDKCFEIIKEGKGADFDPEIAEIFLNARPKVEKIYYGNMTI